LGSFAVSGAVERVKEIYDIISPIQIIRENPLDLSKLKDKV